MKVILDNGHGGMIDNIYQTKGKRSYFEDLGHFYEGVYNRIIVNNLAKLCKENNIDYHVLVPEQTDVSLFNRVLREHKVYEKGDILLSIHCDAFGKQTANGFTTFSYNNISKGSRLLNKHYSLINPSIRNRGCKTANFYMLKKTKSKSILIECGFMTNYKNVKYLNENIDKVTKGIFNYIKENIK